MNAQTSALRRAAILVASLDEPTAARLLAQMEPEQADEVRAAVAQLGTVERSEQEEVIAAFVGARPQETPADTVEVSESLRQRISQQAPEALAQADGSGEGQKPFAFLQSVDAQQVARSLEGERPQTIALVVAHLPPERAGEVLASLPGGLQADVLRRLVDLGETHPEVLREIESSLESRIQVHAQRVPQNSIGLGAIQRILKSADRGVGAAILENLAQHNTALADRLGHRRVVLESLDPLGDADRARVLRQAGPEVTRLALAGWSPELVGRVLEHFPPAEARAYAYALEHLGPMRLSDIEQAQTELVEVAREMVAAGTLQPGPMLRAVA